MCYCAELRNCVKVEMAVLGSTSLIVILIVLVISVDIKQHLKKKCYSALMDGYCF